jgi:rare lipoprotein A
MNAYTAAHRNLPFGTIVRVTNLDNGRVVKVRINDRGPYVKSRIIDLSAEAARALGMRQKGIAHVRIEQFASDQPPTS